MHALKVNGQSFIVDKNYSYLRSIGSGAYGVVISALNESSGVKVAIKKVPNAFADEIDAKRILREIKLLRSFRHENVIGIVDMVDPNCDYTEDFNDIYIITDLMETDLHRIIYSKQPLTNEHVQYFLYQILRGMKYIHSANVLHRDLKPSNLLVNGNCDLKICDLGLARGILPEDDGIQAPVDLTEYVVTRWYRAPEIMLACSHYSKAVDVWSIGCIFGELLGRKPLVSGGDYIEQLRLIVDLIGKPKEDELDFVTSEKARKYIMKLPDCGKPKWNKVFPKATDDALDLLDQLLQFDPEKRITCTEALAHPYLSQLANPNDEPVAGFDFDFVFEEEELNRARLRELIWSEVGAFRPKCLPVPDRRSGGKNHK